MRCTSLWRTTSLPPKLTNSTPSTPSRILAGLREDEISPKTLFAALSAVRAAADHPRTRARKVSLIGASTGATLSLLVAKHPQTKDRVASVCGLAPFSDVRTALSLATTEHYLKDG